MNKHCSASLENLFLSLSFARWFVLTSESGKEISINELTKKISLREWVGRVLFSFEFDKSMLYTKLSANTCSCCCCSHWRNAANSLSTISVGETGADWLRIGFRSSIVFVDGWSSIESEIISQPMPVKSISVRVVFDMWLSSLSLDWSCRTEGNWSKLLLRNLILNCSSAARRKWCDDRSPKSIERDRHRTTQEQCDQKASAVWFCVIDMVIVLSFQSATNLLS